MTPRWRPTTALLTAVAVAVAALALAVLMRRADLVVVAAPLLAGTLTPLLRHRAAAGGDTVEVRVPVETVWEGDLAHVTVALRVADADGADLARIAVEHGPGVHAEGAATLQCVRPAPDGAATAELTLRAERWGRAIIGPAQSSITAAHGLLRRDASARQTTTLAIVPLREIFQATDSVPKAAGLVGTHRSRLPGAGTDLLAVRPFAPGDRLRRITWPVSLRTGTLHVTSTTDDRDAEVHLLVDSAVDVGDPASADGSSLDRTVRAAGAVAEHYLRRGDRVGLLDLGSARPAVALGSGRAHLLRVLAALLGASATTQTDPDRIARQLTGVSTRGLVMVFSTLLDERVVRHLAALARRGHALLVVDTLPPDAAPAGAARRTDAAQLAWRLALLSREDLVRRLGELGVPVVPWRGARSLDAVLLALSRAAAAPRVRR